ncbi:hypothetical protein PC128_g18622 [Phytophthora cactorum]|nr:hypothetical protein PC128_g18622 [Phytophthora cactorum]
MSPPKPTGERPLPSILPRVAKRERDEARRSRDNTRRDLTATKSDLLKSARDLHNLERRHRSTGSVAQPRPYAPRAATTPGPPRDDAAGTICALR